MHLEKTSNTLEIIEYNHMPGTIALITDFGYTDSFAGTMKGVIKSINPSADIIDITHSVRSFSIPNAQFVLYSSYKYFPAETIFVVVIDPGVGTERKGLVAYDGSYYYVLPDNGLLSAVASPDMKTYNIDMALFSEASTTFHGRDIFAPVAARLSLGKRPEEFGTLISDAVQYPFPEFRAFGSGAMAKIIHIDKFGNTTTTIPNDAIEHGKDISYSVTSDSYTFNCVCVHTYGDLGANDFGLIRSSSGFIELAVNQGSIAERFRIDIGDRLVLKQN